MKEEVTKAFNSMTLAFAADDYEKIADLYTKDAKILYSEKKLFEGREGVVQFYKGAKEKVGIYGMEAKPVVVEQLGDNVNVINSYVIYAADSSVMAEGYAMNIWRMEDGVLKIRWDATV